MNDALKRAQENHDSYVDEIVEKKDNNVVKQETNNQFPNGHVKWGIFFTLLSILAGDILKMIGVGFIFQQTALSVGFGMFGLGLILYGSFQLVILRLDKLIEDKGSE